MVDGDRRVPRRRMSVGRYLMCAANWLASPSGGVGRDELLQLVDAERRRVHLPLGREPARVPRVVLADVVAEPGALPDDHRSLVGVEPADRDEDEGDEQRDVEDQVAGLAAVALLRGERDRAGRLDALLDAPAAAELAAGGGRELRRRGGRLEPVRLGQPVEVARCGQRLAQHRPRVQPDPRDQAADERDEQQQVDRREPHRAEDVVHADAVEEPPPRAVRADVGPDLGRVQRALRQQRSGHGGDREQEQQDERRPHRGEPAPQPAGERTGSCGYVEPRRVVATSPPGASVRRCGPTRRSAAGRRWR